MLAKHEIDCVPLAELAVATLKSMDDIVDAFAGEIQVLRDDIQTIGSLALKSEAGEREKALSFYTSAHETAKQHLGQVRRSGGLSGLGSPIKTARGLHALREARTDLAQAESVFDAPAAASRRESRPMERAHRVQPPARCAEPTQSTTSPSLSARTVTLQSGADVTKHAY